MMEYKGQADRAEIDPTAFDVGEIFTTEIGDWNGTGFSYKENGNTTLDLVVVDVMPSRIIVVKKDDRLDWNRGMNFSECDQYEITIYQNGTVDGYETLENLGWIPVLKRIERYDSWGGAHMVKEGRRATGRE